MADEPTSLHDMILADNAATPPADPPPASTPEPPDDPGPASTPPPDSIPAPKASDPPAEGDPTPKPDDGGPDVSDPTPGSVLERAKAIIGDKPWVAKYKTDEDLLRGIDNLQSMIGQRDENAQVVQALQRAGITDDDVRQLLAMKSQPQPTATTPGAAPLPEWDKKWASVDGEGNVHPTADAPVDFEARLAKRKAAFAAAILDDEKAREFFGGTAPDSPQGMTQQQVDQRFAQAEEQRNADSWLKDNAKTLFINSTHTDGRTAVGEEVNRILEAREEVNPSLPWHRQATVALRIATERIGMTPPDPADPHPSSHRQSAPAARPKKKETDEEFFARKKEDGGKASFIDFLQHAEPEAFKKQNTG